MLFAIDDEEKKHRRRLSFVVRAPLSLNPDLLPHFSFNRSPTSTTRTSAASTTGRDTR